MNVSIWATSTLKSGLLRLFILVHVRNCVILKLRKALKCQENQLKLPDPFFPRRGRGLGMRLNPRHACTARVALLCLSVCLCLSHAILAPQAQ